MSIFKEGGIATSVYIWVVLQAAGEMLSVYFPCPVSRENGAPKLVPVNQWQQQQAGKRLARNPISKVSERHKQDIFAFLVS